MLAIHLSYFTPNSIQTGQIHQCVVSEKQIVFTELHSFCMHICDVAIQTRLHNLRHIHQVDLYEMFCKVHTAFENVLCDQNNRLHGSG